MLVQDILRLATGPVNTPEVAVQHLNFFIKGKVSGLQGTSKLGQPRANPGHASGTLPFAATIENTIPYPSEAGPAVNVSTEIAAAFPDVTNPSIDAIKLIIGGRDTITRGISVRLRVDYTPGGPMYQPSSVSFIMDQGPVIIYIFTLRRQGGILYLAPIAEEDGLAYHVDSAPNDGIQGNYADITYIGATLSDPIVAEELSEFDFQPANKGDSCATKSRHGKGRR